jgi:adenosylcobinamide kinase/adenosylcobinamide-phosphate guanylyltransferase
MKDKQLILILGGARSGKSAFAQRLAQRKGQQILFVATAEADDQEMQERIKRHQANRPREWHTVEEPLHLERILTENTQYDLILIDCLSLWVSNLLCHQDEPLVNTTKESTILATTSRLLDIYKQSQATLLLVSNEVGMGVVPPYPLGREFRDIQGQVNQLIASRADQVYLVVAGLAVALKALGAEEL